MILDFAWLVVQGIIVFAASTLLFDALHYLLHRWQRSRFRLLRMFSAWHNVHHEFLDKNMKIHPELVWKNFWFHLLPEFGTSVLGTVPFYLVFHWLPVTVILALHVIMFVLRCKEEGMDYGHMAMDRIPGQRWLWFVNPAYHAMHHVHPLNHYSSYTNVFDLIAGTNCQIKGRRFLVTGANGAFGSAMVSRLEKLGARVETAQHDTDYCAGDCARLRDKLEWADVLILAHGAKTEGAWDANYTTFVELIDMFEELGRDRLTPPEVWAVGSEIELHGDLGMESLKDYAASKKAFARRAIGYYTSQNLVYRHIVPSAFTSPMGRGLMSADTAVSIALFFIRRGFTYVPVTFTGLAWINYIRFRFLQGRPERSDGGLIEARAE